MLEIRTQTDTAQFALCKLQLTNYAFTLQSIFSADSFGISKRSQQFKQLVTTY